MKIKKTNFEGLKIIEGKKFLDKRGYFRETNKKKYIKNYYVNSKLPKKIYINRKLDSNISARAIINSKEVESTMKKLGFKSVTLSDLTFKKQVELFKSVNFIVGLHGAGFANMVFSKPGTKIVEITSHHSGDLFLRLAKKCKLNYKRIFEKNVLSSLKFQSSHIAVDINKLKQLILSFR